MHILQTVNQKMSWLERPQSKQQKPGKSRNIVKAPALNYQQPFCLQEWRHSMIVVASMKYPPHSTHMRCGLSSVIFILVVRCILAERLERGRGKTCTERKEKKGWNGRKRRQCLERTSDFVEATIIFYADSATNKCGRFTVSSDLEQRIITNQSHPIDRLLSLG